MARAGREWYTTIRLDQGGKYRFAFNRHIMVRFVEYMLLSHVYEYISNHSNSSLAMTLVDMSHRFNS